METGLARLRPPPSCFAQSASQDLAPQYNRSRMPSEALAKEGRLHYVHLLESIGDQDRRDVGQTSDLKRRLAEHNAGKSSHTSKFLPWKIVTYMAFSEERKAVEFERYLKSGSGHTFANERLW